MSEPSWADKLSAVSAFATALLTLTIAVMAVAAWRTAKRTLEQARQDSIEQTRPYVYVEIVPGLAGGATYDLRISNVGKSSAYELTLDYDNWPGEPDDVARSIQTLFRTSRTLPPTCTIRTIWRLQSGDGTFTDGSTEAGLGRSGRISVRYRSNDPQSLFEDSFEVMIDNSGMWPVPEDGPDPGKLTGETRKFYILGQALIRRVGELGR